MPRKEKKYNTEERYFIPKKHDMSNLDQILTPRMLEIFKLLAVERLKATQIAEKLEVSDAYISVTITSIVDRINKHGSDEFKSRFNLFLKQRKIKQDRKWKKLKTNRVGPGVFLNKAQMKKLLRESKKP